MKRIGWACTVTRIVRRLVLHAKLACENLYIGEEIDSMERKFQAFGIQMLVGCSYMQMTIGEYSSLM